MSKRPRTERDKQGQRAYYQRNKKRLAALHRDYALTNKESVAAIKRAYAERNPDLVVFRAQRNQARKRGIAFLLTFEEWLLIWQQSGHAHERGRHSYQYCMARFGDVGPYAVNNVKIITQAENAAEQIKRNPNRNEFGRFVEARQEV